MLSPSFLLYLIELRSRTEPSGYWCAYCLVGKSSLLIANLTSGTPFSPCSSVRHELCMTAFLETEEPEDGCLNRATDCQKPVVL